MFDVLYGAHLSSSYRSVYLHLYHVSIKLDIENIARQLMVLVPSISNRGAQISTDEKKIDTHIVSLSPPRFVELNNKVVWQRPV